MHFLFVTYRWGSDLLGGAESHHQRLAQELVDAGHRVSVITSTGHGISPLWHWGLQWEDAKQPGAESDNGIPIRRLPRGKLRKWQALLGAKLIQQRLESEEEQLPEGLRRELAEQAAGAEGVFLLNGWHYPDLSGGELSRWTHRRFALLARTADRPARVVLKGNLPKAQRVQAYVDGRLVWDEIRAAGWFDVAIPVPPHANAIVELRLQKLLRPPKDHRGLGVWLNHVELALEDGRSLHADLFEDFRSLGRRVWRPWTDYLIRRAEQRPAIYGRVFDRLRGPVIKGLRPAIDSARADHVIHCNMPWGNLSAVREGELAMPLWHIEDEFYAWGHYIDALRRARFVLANTPFTAEHFFPPLGIKAHFVGPPIWEPDLRGLDEEVREFRAKLNLAPQDVLVVTVCRKSGEKRYDAVARSVERLRRAGLPLRMIGIGPDIDGRPFQFEGCEWLGKMTGRGLQTAYAASDILGFLSESESFGMVIPEAWHHGKPVVVNRYCGATASLVEPGVDGLLAGTDEEVDAALRRLAEDPQLRRSMGENGRTKAQANYVRGASAKRLLAALEG